MPLRGIPTSIPDTAPNRDLSTSPVSSRGMSRDRVAVPMPPLRPMVVCAARGAVASGAAASDARRVTARDLVRVDTKTPSLRM